MKKLFYTFLLISCAQLAIAQQYPLFTNYVMNCFGYNPGVAGSTDYVDVRFGLRSQWQGEDGAPQTQILSAHGKLKKAPIGLGGYVFNDVAGNLRRTGGSAVVSYSKLFNEQHRVCVGLAAGYYNFRLDAPATAMASDPTLANAGMGMSMPDFNAGIYYQHSSGFFAGLSVPQVAGGKLNFTDAPDSDNTPELMRHYYYLLGYNYAVNDNITIQPSALIKQTVAAPIQVDASVIATMKNGLWGGISYRTSDALAAMIGFNLSKKLTLGYAYDITTSNLNNFSNGSHEISIGYKLGYKEEDKDEDGVPDDKDKCPEEPGTEENEGCPAEDESDKDDEDKEDEDEIDPDLDTDLDGVKDVDDGCVNVPGLKENGGCPWGDRDDDGIRDDIDKCPDTSGMASNEGCPLTDRDNDGIVDNKDNCPDIAGSMANIGCPGEPANNDVDGDGVPNAIDTCPNVAGYNGAGCPQANSYETDILDMAIRNLYFDTDKAKIKRRAYQYLDRLAELLVSKREMRISIEGYADPRGDEYHNLRLSRRRAEAVRNYLLDRGVRREQMRVDYFGEREGLDPNGSDYELQEGRKVEMSFVFD